MGGKERGVERQRGTETPRDTGTKQRHSEMEVFGDRGRQRDGATKTLGGRLADRQTDRH